MSSNCQTATTSPWVAAAIIATVAGALVFVVSYAWRSRGRWRGSSVGRNVMALTAVILAVSVLAASGIAYGQDWPHRDVVRFVAWSAVAAVVWWQVVVLYRVQRRGR